MASSEFLILITLEIALLALVLVCGLANALTLKEAIRDRLLVIRAGDSNGGAAWTLISLRHKICFFCIQVLFVVWGIDRLYFLVHYGLTDVARFVVYGLARASASVLIAWVAWSAMCFFRKLQAK